MKRCLKGSMFERYNYLKIALYVVVGTLSLGQFTSLGGGEGSTLYLFDIAVAGFVFLGFFKFITQKKDLYVSKSLFLFLGFLILALISFFFRITTLGQSTILNAFFYLLRWAIYFFGAVVFSNMVRSNEITTPEFFRLIFISATFISIAGFGQLFILPDFTVLDPSLGWDPHKNRLASTFFDPNFTGGYLGLSVGIALGSFFKSEFSKFKLTGFEKLVFVFVPLVALFLTFSRSSWGMLVVIILTLAFFEKKAKSLFVVAIIFGFLTYFAVPRVQTRVSGVTDPADSAAFRLVSWKNTLEIAKDHLFLGTGFNTFRYFQKQYGFFEPGEIGGNSGAGSDSSFLLVLATTGIFGFAFFVLGYLKGIFKLFKAKEFALVGVFSGLLLHSQFVNSLFYPQIMFLWLCLLSIDYSLQD